MFSLLFAPDLKFKLTSYQFWAHKAEMVIGKIFNKHLQVHLTSIQRVISLQFVRYEASGGTSKGLLEPEFFFDMVS